MSEQWGEGREGGGSTHLMTSGGTTLALATPAPLEGWEENGACYNKAEIRLFFSSVPHEEQEAKRLCDVCPVMEECLDFAIRTRQPFGIWGGMTTGERSRYVRTVHYKRRPGAQSA